MHTITEKVGIVNEVVSYMQNADNQKALRAGKWCLQVDTGQFLPAA